MKLDFTKMKDEVARLEILVAQRGIQEVARIDLNHTIETEE